MVISPQIGLPPGIYFGLSEEVYHKDPALSRSDMVNLLDTPNSYWKNSFMNPDRSRKKASDPMDYGSAFDCLMFDGLKAFEKKYRIVGLDEWTSENKEFITHDNYFKIAESIKVLRKGKDSTLFLSGGLPQVTIIFDELGMRFRTRHDFFTPVLSTDFKTARNLHEGHLKRAFIEYGYDIQFWLYTHSRRRIKEMLRAGAADVYGDVDPAFFAKFMGSDVDEFVFVFQRSSPPYPFLPLMPEDDTEESGQKRGLRAIGIYQKSLAEYGSKEWPVCEGKIKPFSIYYGLREEK